MTTCRSADGQPTGLIAGIQRRPVFMWCCKLDIGSHHACWLLLQDLFIIASALTATSTTATRTTKPRHLFFDRPGRREAGGHSISRIFRRLSPFPFARLPVESSDLALDHFVAPFVACHDEGSEIAAAEAKRAKRHHNDDLQPQLAHDPSLIAPHPC